MKTFILGFTLSLIILAFSSKLVISSTKILIPIESIPTLLLTLTLVVGPLFLFLYINKLFEKKLSLDKSISKSLKISSIIISILYLIEVIFYIPVFYSFTNPDLTTSFILIASIIFTIEMTRH